MPKYGVHKVSVSIFSTCIAHPYKSHNQKYYITLCILKNIIETLELQTHNHKQHLSYQETVQ